MNRATAAMTHTADYYSSYAYDPDGNLKKLVRNGNLAAQLQMDSLEYVYFGVVNTPVNDNRLIGLVDYAPNAYNNDIKQYLSAGNNRYYYDYNGNVTGDLVTGNNMLWNHYNKTTLAASPAQNRTLNFEYDGAGQRYLKGLSLGYTGAQAGDALNDYYVRDAQGNILAVYKDDVHYTMQRLQWVEYIVAEVLKRCDRKVALNMLLRNFLHNKRFKASLIASFNEDYDFVMNVAAARPVSFFLQDQPSLSTLLSGSFRQPALFRDLASYSGAHSTNVLGMGLNSLLEDAGQRQLFLEAVCAASDSSETDGDYLDLLCTHAPDVMRQVMEDFGTRPFVRDDCGTNIGAVSGYISDAGMNYLAFAAEVEAAASAYSAEYQSLILALNAPNLVFEDPVTGQTGNSLTLMCATAKDLMEKALTEMSIAIPSSHSCEDLTAIVSELARKTPAVFRTFWNNIVKWGPSYADQYNHYGACLLHVRVSDPVQDVWQQAASFMPATTIALAQYLGADSTSADSAALFLKAYRSVHQDQQSLQQIAGFIAAKVEPDGDLAGFKSFVDVVATDEIWLNKAGALGSGSGNMIALFNKALEQPVAREGLTAFMDKWSGARDLLNSTFSGTQQLELIYRADPAQLTDDYIAYTGNTEVLPWAIVEIPGLTPDNFIGTMRDLPRYCLTTEIVDSILHATYVQAISTRRFSLAEHDLYGGSRIGTANYLPGQFYAYYDFSGPEPIKDTAKLATARPWYSLEYNDLIAGMALEPYNNTDPSSYYLNHTIGLRQYEVTNHLGNVQATISDLPYPKTIDDSITAYAPALAAAYDYYPFGMLMPGRFVSDESEKCLTLTQTQWVTNWEEYCYDVYKWVFPKIRLINSASIKVAAGLLDFDLSHTAAQIDFEERAVPNMTQELSMNISEWVSGAGSISVIQVINGHEQVLSSQLINKASLLRLTFTPATDLIQVRILGPVRVKVSTICVKRPVQTQQDMLVDVCSGSNDRYRFGFNGQEKVNEWAGIGNHNTAEFWEYDTRTARRQNLDPKDIASESPYCALRSSPIAAGDPNGDFTPIITGLIGGAIDAAFQLTEIAISDDKTLEDFSWTSVFISTALGATGAGLTTVISTQTEKYILNKVAQKAVIVVAETIAEAGLNITEDYTKAVVKDYNDGKGFNLDQSKNENFNPLNSAIAAGAGKAATETAGYAAKKMLRNSGVKKLEKALENAEQETSKLEKAVEKNQDFAQSSSTRRKTQAKRIERAQESARTTEQIKKRISTRAKVNGVAREVVNNIVSSNTKTAAKNKLDDQAKAQMQADQKKAKCFVAGTLVNTSKGYKCIEDITTEDSVLSFNQQSHRFEFCRVLNTFSRESDEIVAITMQSGLVISVTPEHSFLVNKGVWVPSGKLKTSDRIWSLHGKEKIKHIAKSPKEVKVYNFEVQNTHTYIVTKMDLVTHNTEGLTCK
jgi:hypothetical protein